MSATFDNYGFLFSTLFTTASFCFLSFKIVHYVLEIRLQRAFLMRGVRVPCTLQAVSEEEDGEAFGGVSPRLLHSNSLTPEIKNKKKHRFRKKTVDAENNHIEFLSLSSCEVHWTGKDHDGKIFEFIASHIPIPPDFYDVLKQIRRVDHYLYYLRDHPDEFILEKDLESIARPSSNNEVIKMVSIGSIGTVLGMLGMWFFIHQDRVVFGTGCLGIILISLIGASIYYHSRRSEISIYPLGDVVRVFHGETEDDIIITKDPNGNVQHQLQPQQQQLQHPFDEEEPETRHEPEGLPE